MWRRNALLLVFSAVSLTATLPVLAQSGSPPETPRINPEKVDPAKLGKLLWSSDYVAFDLVLGRITARNASHGKARIATMGDLATGDGECLTLRVMEGAPRLRYELRVGAERFLVTANDIDRFVIEHHAEDGKQVVRYEQSPREPVQLILQHDDKTRRLTAPSLWHLWLRHPELCETHMQPCLNVLKPNWNIGRSMEQIEQQLFASRGPYFLPGDEPLEADYRAWLKALSDDRFAVRQAAFTKFRNAGVAAKPFLDQLDIRHLDGEQRMRIRQLRKSLVFRSPDSVNRISAWLRDDRWIWFAYLNDRQSDKRRVAYRHLKRICGDSLSYDPEAEADLRESQITSLQRRVFR